VILFSHIPLARPDWTDCGPLREHGTIRAGVGRGYQNTLSSEMSRALLDAVRPVVVFRFVGSASFLSAEDLCSVQW
jgi:hypothetical protein